MNTQTLVHGSKLPGTKPIETIRMRANNKQPVAARGIRGADNFENREIEILQGQATGLQKIRPVAIFSPDRSVRDFLQGILVFQGYQCTGTHEGEATFWSMTIHRDQVVFLDGLYLLGDESEAVRHRVKESVQASMTVMMLADRRWGADSARTWEVGGCRILWKPLDYRQVGHVMGQI